MVQLLNLIIKKPIILLINFYQRFLSDKINRSCIYEKSCSNYAHELFSKPYNVIHALKDTLKRTKGCKIVDIICEDTNNWHIINGNSEIVKSDKLNIKTKKDIERTIKKELESYNSFF